ncbi:MAG: nitroreductase family deazaflavin-dependent oxidoreductase [Proteobacteria bacterium]|nr:nitroreductase family deazaflavin-dependent oxidoreductase [Pseudomonadota bacterium]
MPVPMWMARINRRVFNPREITKGVRPVLTHVGRKSGATYHTPLDAHPVEGGYIFIVMYGPKSDWVKNILASGDATLTVEGVDAALTNPRIIGKDEAFQLLSADVKAPPGFLKVSEYLVMDTST